MIMINNDSYARESGDEKLRNNLFIYIYLALSITQVNQSCINGLKSVLCGPNLTFISIYHFIYK